MPIYLEGLTGTGGETTAGQHGGAAEGAREAWRQSPNTAPDLGPTCRRPSKRRRRSCVVLGAREDGEKELLAPGYRESTESWADVMRDLRDRGLAAVGRKPTRSSRCWNHRVLNVRRLPKRLQARKPFAKNEREAYVAELHSKGLQGLGGLRHLLPHPKVLGAPANQTPSSHGFSGVRLTLPGECPLPGVQAGGAPQRKLAERGRESDGPGLGGTMWFPRWSVGLRERRLRRTDLQFQDLTRALSQQSLGFIRTSGRGSGLQPTPSPRLSGTRLKGS